MNLIDTCLISEDDIEQAILYGSYALDYRRLSYLYQPAIRGCGRLLGRAPERTCPAVTMNS